jgi:hypothetical protein
MGAQRFNFGAGQLAPCTWWHISEGYWSFSHAYQPLHMEAEHTGNFSDLPLPAFVEHHAQPRPAGATLQHLGPRAGGDVAGRELDAGSPPAQRVEIGCVIDEDPVLLVHFEARMGQSIRQVAVVSQQHQAFTIGVQASYGEHTYVAGHQLQHRRPVVGILRGGDYTGRLVQQEIAMRLSCRGHMDELPIHGYHIRFGIGSRAELPYNPAVDGDTSLEDHILGRPQCRNTGMREYFVETVQHAGTPFGSTPHLRGATRTIVLAGLLASWRPAEGPPVAMEGVKHRIQ